jgi:hypothetical protein
MAGGCNDSRLNSQLRPSRTPLVSPVGDSQSIEFFGEAGHPQRLVGLEKGFFKVIECFIDLSGRHHDPQSPHPTTVVRSESVASTLSQKEFHFTGGLTISGTSIRAKP